MSAGASAGHTDRARPRRDPNHPLRLLRLIAATLAIALLVVVILAMIFEESLIFLPSRYDGAAAWTPSGLDYEDVFFAASDGTQLHGWYCPSESPRAVVLFAHGNAGDITYRTDIARRLQRMGLSVFLFDYRGYGRSEGKPNEEGVLLDARAARGRLAELAGVVQQDIVLMGRSLGGAVAVDLAAQEGARGLILENTFTSMPDVAAVHYPWLPVRTFMRTRLDSVSKLPSYRGPILQSHAEHDSIIPLQLGRRLFDAARADDGYEKTFFTVERADHNDPHPREYYLVLDQFIDALR